MNAEATLQDIQDRLSETSPLPLIEELLPRCRTEAPTWARRLPGWEQYRGQFADQVIGLARIISRRAMKEHALRFNDEGREGAAKKPRPRQGMLF